MFSGLLSPDIASPLRGMDKTVTGAGNLGGYLGGGAGVVGKNGSVSGDYGGGLGAGYNSFTGKGKDGTISGYSGGLGQVEHVGGAAQSGKSGGAADLNFYRGIGGSAYSFSSPGGTDSKTDPARQGYGAEGSYTPLGLANSSVAWQAPLLGQGSVRADNAYLNKQTVGGQVSRDSSGKYAADAFYGRRSGVDNATLTSQNALGTSSLNVGHASIGDDVTAGGSYDSKTGSGEVHGSYIGQGFKVSDSKFNTNLGNGALTGNAHLGGYDSTNTYDGSASYNNQTGVAKLQGHASAGGTSITDAGFDFKSKYGASTSGGVGMINTGGYDVKGSVEVDPRTGAITATGGGRGGGMQVKDANFKGSVKGLGSVDASMESFSNDTIVEGVKYQGSGAKQSLSVDKIDGGGMRFGKTSVKEKNDLLHTSVDAGFDNLSSTNSVEGLHAASDLSSWKNADVNGGFKTLSVGGWSGQNLHADVTGPGNTSASAKVGSFNQGFTGQGGSFDLSSKNGLTAGLQHGNFDEFTMSGVDAKVGIGDLYKAQAHLGEGSFNHFSADNMKVAASLSKGVSASLDNGQYSYLAGKDIALSSSALGGRLQQSVSAKSASALGVDIGHLDYQTTGRNTDLAVDNLGAHGFKAQDLAVSEKIGQLSAGASAKEADLLNLNVGKLALHTGNFGTQGNAAVEKANLDVLNLQGAHAGLGWGGKEVLGASGDLKAGLGLDSAHANYDLLAGKASGDFKNLSSGAQLNNANVNLFGTNFALPNMGYKMNASGGGNVDLSHGAANANLSLAGSSVNFAGHQLTLPSWAQASAGVDLSQGAANVNLGGKNGIGADINLAHGELDLNAFGYDLNVGQGVRDIGSGIANGASAIGHGLADGASAVGHGISNVASGAAHAISSAMPWNW